MVNHCYATQVDTFTFGGFPNDCFIAQQGNACNVLARAHGSGYYGPRVVAFRQNNMLRIAGSALPQCLEYVIGLGVRDCRERVYQLAWRDSVWSSAIG